MMTQFIPDHLLFDIDYELIAKVNTKNSKRDARRKQAARARSSNRCYDCGQPPVPGKRRCEKHVAAAFRASAKFQASKKKKQVAPPMIVVSPDACNLLKLKAVRKRKKVATVPLPVEKMKQYEWDRT